MELDYPININDSLQLYLFTATKSPSIRKRRLWRRLVTPVLLVIYAFIYFFTNTYDKTTLVICAFIVFLAVVLAVCYPFYERFFYKRSYLKSLREIYKNKDVINYKVIFNESNVELYNDSAYSKIALTALASIDETGSYFFILIKNTKSYILIPKQKIHNVEEVKTMLRTLSDKQHIPFFEELNWKWK